MRLVPVAISAIALGLFAAAGALSQSDSGAPAVAALTCGEIAEAPPAYQAALVYYAAGYRQGLTYERTVASAGPDPSSSLPVEAIGSAPAGSSELAGDGVSGSSSSAEAAPASASSQASSNAAAPNVIAGLTLQAQDIITACSAAPDVLVTDIIANHGGATGFAGSPSAGGGQTTAGGTAVTTTQSSAPPAGALAGGSSAMTNSGTDAVSNDLNAASGQLQQNIQTSPPIGGGTTSPAPGTTTTPAPGATGTTSP